MAEAIQKNQLLLWAVGPWQDSHLSELLHALSERGCESHDLRISQLQEGFAAQMVVGGNWSAVGKLETALPSIAEKLGVEMGAIRIPPRVPRADQRPFAVELTAPQQPDLFPALVGFFAHQGVSVIEAVCQPYEAHLSTAPMVNMQVVLMVPTTAQPPALREAFMDFCDDYHADGIFDPIKS
ncbi:MAG: ACT domain-containing protein [Oceanococcaceae bacterium]